MWACSTPTLLDRITIGATGSGAAQFAFPVSMAAAGDHTLVVTGTSASGRTVTMAIGIVVTATKALTAAGSPAPKSHGGGAWWWWLIPGAAFAALSLALLVVWWRRRNGDRLASGSRRDLSLPVTK